MEEQKQEQKEEKKLQMPLSILEQAEAIAKRIEEANKKSEELLKKNEETISKVMLSGRASAGTPTPVVDVKKLESFNRIKAFGEATGAKWAKDMKFENP